MSHKKALIAMSGGVDSSVAALMIKEMGYQGIGCTMKLFDGNDDSPHLHSCCSLSDVEDARNVAYRLGMKHYVFNLKDDFKEKVIENFVESYKHGITPNPCIECNRYLKFDKLFDKAKILGCDYVVTGHYAIIDFENGKYILKKALDDTKDQSYVLYSMTQQQLAHTLFPLGKMKKTQTRKIASDNGFVNAKKPDSQDICFVQDGDYVKFIENYTNIKQKPGNFVDTTGNKIGEHNGIIGFTIGQRKGLGVQSQTPLYVCDIRANKNEVVLGNEDDLYDKIAYVKDFNWISGENPQKEVRCKVKIRYRQAEQYATIFPMENGSVKIVFDVPQKAITPGQAAVAYDVDIVLGGGIIFEKEKDYAL